MKNFLPLAALLASMGWASPQACLGQAPPAQPQFFIQVTFRVATPNDAPVPGARVYAQVLAAYSEYNPDPVRGLGPGVGEMRYGTTGPDGRVRLDLPFLWRNLTTATVIYWAAKEGYQRMGWGQRVYSEQYLWSIAQGNTWVVPPTPAGMLPVILTPIPAPAPAPWAILYDPTPVVPLAPVSPG